MAELVQEPFAAVRSFAAPVSVAGNAMPAVEASAVRDSLQLVFKFFIRLAPGGGKHKVMRVLPRLPAFVFAQGIQQGRGNRALSLFLIFGLEAELLFRSDTYAIARVVDVRPGGVTNFFIPFSREQEKQIKHPLVCTAGVKQSYEVFRLIHLANIADKLRLVAFF